MNMLDEIILISFAIIMAICLVPVLGAVAVWYWVVKSEKKDGGPNEQETDDNEIWEQNLGV